MAASLGLGLALHGDWVNADGTGETIVVPEDLYGAVEVLNVRVDRKEKLNREVKVTTRDSLILSKKLTESLGLEIGDRLTA